MRLHRLEVEAFGPFAGRVSLDLDAVSASGLFLVHGPTGSGKTSLLDAVCFALYADVPGARQKHGLRSDHAAPEAVPRVVLELTVAGRRLRITRSPAWQRPKKRGAGTTPVQASVVLEERRDGGWQAVSIRNDEVADEVRSILGMGLAQFATVVLLPQGEFAAFLRATPEDRRDVLERLFDVGVFADVEQWLVEARRTGAAALEAARSGLDTDLLRLDDALAGVPGLLADPADPADADGDAPPPLGSVGVDGLAARLADVADALALRLTGTLAAVDAAETAEASAQSALDTARELAGRQQRGRTARARLEHLAAAATEHTARRDELDAADRAATVAGHLQARHRAVAEVDSAEALVTRRRAAAVGLGLDTDLPAADLLTAVRALDAAAEAVGREAGPARDLAAALDAAVLDAQSLAAERDALAESLPALAAAASSAELELTRVLGEVARLPGLEHSVQVLRGRLGTLDEVDAGTARLEALAPRLVEARDDLLARQSELLTLRSRRLDQMAAELAAGLGSGDPCPVCGSAEHPAPAVAADPVTPEALSTAESRLEAAQAAVSELDREVSALQASVRARAEDLDGVTRDALTADLTRAGAALERARAAGSGLDAARATRDTHRSAAASAEVRHERVLATLEVTDERLTALTEEAGQAASRLEEALATHATCPCASPDPAGHTRARDALAHLLRAEEEAEAARTRLATVTADLDAAAEAAGFGSAAEAGAAVRDAGATDRLRDAVLGHARDLDAARAVLAEPEVEAALKADAPPVEDLVAASRAARRAVLEAVSTHEAVGRAVRALEALRPGLEARCADLAGLAARQAGVRELADAVGGTGGDNTLRMRLSSFVLAARLEKVATLANERLAVMGAGRYVLEHTDERAARGARSGLGLRVLDQWTGRARDTASLSGGETFMASLALALGLADAVREESGGLDLGTLFIDEGFGSLDDESLEQVLTVLDGLREGGRAVGVVSHVADLRARIPHQIVVTKGAAGSSVATRTAAEAPAA
ncbi:SMC family ATPase [uncultured Phycicoccus sp.]|uniref:AAA family ATPase n=1 Tax=uncultured Phycicoccus sp. TaxID=661422 RepID=UPI00260AC834|nr:SMC family ATPase [uncultured Phycicoccus sp.]